MEDKLKDNLQARKDLARNEYPARSTPKKKANDKYYLPPALYITCLKRRSNNFARSFMIEKFQMVIPVTYLDV
jgi:hypothetical protein